MEDSVCRWARRPRLRPRRHLKASHLYRRETMAVQKIPPIASVEAKGPLGVVQLPRLWSKVLLDAKGLLPEGYAACGNGFDRIVLEGLGLEREEVVGFLTSELPTYARFESWVREKLGGEVPSAAIASVNEKILAYQTAPERRRELLEAMGHADDGSVTHHYQVNMLDDWSVFHEFLTKS